jgi:hypothetical protein
VSKEDPWGDRTPSQQNLVRRLKEEKGGLGVNTVEEKRKKGREAQSKGKKEKEKEKEKKEQKTE